MFPNFNIPADKAAENDQAITLKEQCSRSDLEDCIWNARHKAHYFVRLIRYLNAKRVGDCNVDAIKELRQCRVLCRIAVKAIRMQRS